MSGFSRKGRRQAKSKGQFLNIASPVRTLRPPAELDYYDSRSIPLPVAITPLEAWNLMTSEPGLPIRLAFRTRDAISSLFGVKRIGGFSGEKRQMVRAGERLDFFLVEHSAPEVLVLTERDRHLDVMLCLSIVEQVLTITSSVVTHNTFGRIYMLPVGTAHKLIVHRDLKRLIQKLDARLSASARMDSQKS
jgi:hypothetical protein